MTKATTLHDFMEQLIDMGGTFILRNEHGSMELRGQDMYLHPYNEWLTVYHTNAERPEARSHLHLKRKTLEGAKVCRSEGQTPYLAFSGANERSSEPLLTWYFPSFTIGARTRPSYRITSPDLNRLSRPMVNRCVLMRNQPDAVCTGSE